jgi:nicotinamidase/pyrazinamidase
MNRENTIFFAVDTQKDFLDQDGALYVKDSMTIRENLRLLTKFAREQRIKVVSTADFHTEVSKEISDTPDFINTFPKHCMINNKGSDFIDETDPRKYFEDNYYVVSYADEKIHEDQFDRARNIIIYKDAFNVFVGNALTDEVLFQLQKQNLIENIIVYGVATNICVKFVVDGLLSRGFKVMLVTDAIKELPGQDIQMIFQKWLHQGLIFAITKQVLFGV